MRAFVLDASAALRWFLDKPISLCVKSQKSSTGEQSRSYTGIVAPEVANSLAVAERRKTLTFVEIDEALSYGENLPASALDNAIDYH